ncbi:MAG: ABC transporter ATP-binding protein [Thermoanaerobaculia bacterium]
MTPALEARDLVKAYGGFVAVRDVSLAVPTGSVFGLLGPNGAGKTTTLRMLMDIIAPDRGEVLLTGRARRREDLRRVGYLPEERGLYPKMTVAEHLVFLAELHGLPGRRARAASAEWLERVGLADRAKSRVEQLSKGQQQKVQLVATLLHDPELLVLDEPFSGLDPIHQGWLKEVLADHRRRGGTVLLSTHIMEHAEKLCDHLVLLSGGRAVLAGELAALKRARRGNVWRLTAAGPTERLSALPAVERVEPVDGALRLTLRSGADGPELLRELVSFLAVSEFRQEEPDLERIFLEAVEHAS